MRGLASGFIALSAVFTAVHSATIEVVVGGSAGLKYTPSSVNAGVGDVIRFTFQQKNHTVTQSSLENPCARSANGFDTGFIPVAADKTTDFPVAQLTVVDTQPIWIYCKQGNHCQQGMVFAVNPGDKFPQFLAAATGGTPPAAPPAATTPVSTAAPSQTPAPTTPQPAQVTHRITVGGPNALTFSPSNIAANVGDLIVFEFRQKNHTATASSFDQPCRPLSATSTTGETGWDSGFMPVPEGATGFPTYSVLVNDTKPIWAYCRQGNHCGQGMVFAANAVETGPKNFAAYQALAKQINGTGGGTSIPPYGSGTAPAIHLSALSTTLFFALISLVFIVL